MENPNLKHPELQYNGFSGCIRKITDNGKMYDLKNPLKDVNTKLGCTMARSCPSCGDSGYCEPQWNKDSVCVCNVGYSGTPCGPSKKRISSTFKFLGQRLTI